VEQFPYRHRPGGTDRDDGTVQVGEFMREQVALVAACKLLVAAANAHEAQEELQKAGPGGRSA
jgi:hypothetical protein